MASPASKLNPLARKYISIAAIVALIGFAAAVSLAIYAHGLRAENPRLNAELIDLDRELSQTQRRAQTLRGTVAALEAENDTLQSSLDQATLALQGLAIEAGRLNFRDEFHTAQADFLFDLLAWATQNGRQDDPFSLMQAFAVSQSSPSLQSCQPVAAEIFLGQALPATTDYVITPEKLSWAANSLWSIREDVAFGTENSDRPGYLGSRGYEFRYPLLPGTGPQQEVHTTINVYNSAEHAQDLHELVVVQFAQLNCGITAFVAGSDDPDETRMIWFYFGPYSVNVKLKYYYAEWEDAYSILVQAAGIVLEELTAAGVP